PYAATWESLDTRPNPTWFTDAKFGIFIHWGAYAVPAWGPKDRYAEWYWNDLIRGDGQTKAFHDATYGEDFKYQDFAAQFKAELFDPKQWADTFKRSGAKYIVLTSKHHEGFCLWPNPQAWNWNSVDIGPHRDLAGDLTEAVREVGLKMGFYYSIYEWFNPLYNTDVDRYVDEYMLPQMKDLVQRYQPDLFWPDGEWSHPSSTWRSTEFLAWLFNESKAPKDIAINDRWGKECRNVHGGFATPEYGGIPDGKLIQRGDFEECQGMGHSFGYNRNETADNYRSTTKLLHLLIGNVSRGGNLLLDIGPTADGRIPVVMEQRLLEMGEWLAVNGDAIYGTRKPDAAPEMENVKFTQKGDALYAISLNWPSETLTLSVGKKVSKVTMLGYDTPLKFTQKDGQLAISVPQLTIDKVPCQHAWSFKLE
ncbi:MAG: alpha-L-fucosidase, partial [Candidatus Hydrogenedentes bacterium]|nr:alpha-L-fucosidase [Candidatus Hydrogenedentota bacterium]